MRRSLPGGEGGMVMRNSRQRGHVCTCGKLRILWGLGIWEEGPRKADRHMAEGFAC